MNQLAFKNSFNAQKRGLSDPCPQVHKILQRASSQPGVSHGGWIELARMVSVDFSMWNQIHSLVRHSVKLRNRSRIFPCMASTFENIANTSMEAHSIFKSKINSLHRWPWLNSAHHKRKWIDMGMRKICREEDRQTGQQEHGTS